MVFSNKEEVKRLRMILLIMGASSLFIMAVLVIFEMFGAMVILAALFLIAIFVIALLNFQYVRIMTEKDKLIVRYYSIFSFERSFETFEFPVNLLHNVEVNKYFLGLKWDLRLTVRVQKGLADYPPVSLSAIPFRKRSKLVGELKNLVSRKQP